MNISRFKLAAVIILLGFLVTLVFYAAPAFAQTLTIYGEAFEVGPADSKAPLDLNATAEGNILNDGGKVVGRFSVKVMDSNGKVTIFVQIKQGLPQPGHIYYLDPDKPTIIIKPSYFTFPGEPPREDEDNEFYFSVGNVKDLNNANALKDLVLYAKGSGKVVILAKVTDKRGQVFTGQVKAKVTKDKAYNLKLNLPSVRTDGPMDVFLKVDKGDGAFINKARVGEYREELRAQEEKSLTNRLLNLISKIPMLKNLVPKQEQAESPPWPRGHSPITSPSWVRSGHWPSEASRTWPPSHQELWTNRWIAAGHDPGGRRSQTWPNNHDPVAISPTWPEDHNPEATLSWGLGGQDRRPPHRLRTSRTDNWPGGHDYDATMSWGGHDGRDSGARHRTIDSLYDFWPANHTYDSSITWGDHGYYRSGDWREDPTRRWPANHNGEDSILQ